MWKSGITFRQVSDGVKAKEFAMWRALATIFAFVSGTIFGRAVVPDVCSTNAGSSGPAARTGLRSPVSAAPSSRNKPAASPSAVTRFRTGMPSFAAVSAAAEGPPCVKTIAAGFRSDK